MFFCAKTVFLISFLFSFSNYRATDCRAQEIIAKKYNIKGPFNLGPVVQLIDQRGGLSWMHVVWANLSRHYFSGLVPGQRRSVDRSAFGKAGWWKNCNQWVQDDDIQLALMRLLLDTDLPLAKAFFASQERTKFFTMRKKIYNAAINFSSIKDDSFFQYAGAFYEFLKKIDCGTRSYLLDGVYGCPALYWEVLSSLSGVINVLCESLDEFCDELFLYPGSLLSFLTYQCRVLPGVFQDLLARRIKELCFRVRIDQDHWVLYVLSVNQAGGAYGTWYESRTTERHPLCKAFESVILGAVEQAEAAEDGWVELKKQIDNGRLCAFSLMDCDMLFDKGSGKLTLKIMFDYTTKLVDLTVPGNCMGGHAVAYLSPAEFFEIVKKCSFLHHRSTRPGFPILKNVIGRVIEITPDLGHTYPLGMKFQTDKTAIDQYNAQYIGTKNSSGEEFKPLCSKQSFYFEKINEFLEHIQPMIFVIEPN